MLACYHAKGGGQRTRFIGRERGYRGVGFGFGGISVCGMALNQAAWVQKSRLARVGFPFASVLRYKRGFGAGPTTDPSDNCPHIANRKRMLRREQYARDNILLCEVQHP
ncbi:adenosylmethionine-8-amino-7-oxononanoate aminotransferase [Paraburkholderia sp. MM6662-R1]